MTTRVLYYPSANDGCGSSRQGEMTASYNDLVEMFGHPEEYISGDGKCTFEFVIEYEIEDEFGVESSYFTLYDWKGNRPHNDSEEFLVHIGGKKFEDQWAAKRALELFKKTDVRYGHDHNVLCQGYSHAY